MARKRKITPQNVKRVAEHFKLGHTPAQVAQKMRAHHAGLSTLEVYALYFPERRPWPPDFSKLFYGKKPGEIDHELRQWHRKDKEKRKRDSERLSGSGHPFRGKKLPQEVRDKISEATRGSRNPRYGVALSKETKDKIGRKARGRKLGPHTEEYKRALSDTLKKKYETEPHPMTGRKHSKKTKKATSKSMKKVMEDPEQRRKRAISVHRTKYARMTSPKRKLNSIVRMRVVHGVKLRPDFETVKSVDVAWFMRRYKNITRKLKDFERKNPSSSVSKSMRLQEERKTLLLEKGAVEELVVWKAIWSKGTAAGGKIEKFMKREGIRRLRLER